jgi:hypothetical protein
MSVGNILIFSLAWGIVSISFPHGFAFVLGGAGFVSEQYCEIITKIHPIVKISYGFLNILSMVSYLVYSIEGESVINLVLFSIIIIVLFFAIFLHKIRF